MTTELNTVAEAIDKLRAAMRALHLAGPVSLTKTSPMEPWEIEEMLTAPVSHDACPARTVGDGPTVCMVHHVEIPR